MANQPPPPKALDPSDSYPGTPRWVKVIGIAVLAILLLAAFIVVTGLGGPHGPQRHGAVDVLAGGLLSHATAR